jgi:acetylornithine deacetylase/succinyl-diaminopimelate desuccinylase-like protein
MTSDSSRQELREYADRERQRFEETLRESVEIPSISVDPDHKEDVRREAEFAAELIRSFGGKAEVYPTAGHPIVYGRFDRGDGLPTVTVYNHLDVQPAESDDWKTKPFEFIRQGDRYFGRGTTDDKGPAMTALFGARHA